MQGAEQLSLSRRRERPHRNGWCQRKDLARTGCGRGPGWHMGMWGGGRGDRGQDWMLKRFQGRLAFANTELKSSTLRVRHGTSWSMPCAPPADTTNERMKSIFAGNERSKTLHERVEAEEQFMRCGWRRLG